MGLVLEKGARPGLNIGNFEINFGKSTVDYF
jgi:hypothetical protein